MDEREQHKRLVALEMGQQAHESKLNSHEWRLTHHDGEINQIKAWGQDVDKTLYGNGVEKPGMITIVDRLTQSTLSDKDRRAVYRGPFIVGGVLIVVGALVQGLVAWLVK